MTDPPIPLTIDQRRRIRYIFFGWCHNDYMAKREFENPVWKRYTEMKTIKILAQKYIDEIFQNADKEDFDTKEAMNDQLVTCLAFGNHLMKQPLADRLTEAERSAIRGFYGNQGLDPLIRSSVNGMLEVIFGEEFFKTPKDDKQ